MKRTTIFCLILGAAGCGAGAAEEAEQAELQALLHDEPLSPQTGASKSALSTDGGPISAPPDASTGGGSADAGVDPPPPPPRDASVGPPPPLDGGFFPGPDATPFDPDGSFGGGGDGGFGGGFDGGGTSTTTDSMLGRWSFDDCNPFRTNLFDSTFNNNTAFRAVSVGCVPGIAGQAVSLAVRDEDIVTVPDQPNFLFDNGLTVGGWFNPVSVNQTSTLIRKRHEDSSAFVLLIHNGRYRFVLNLGNGRAASVTSRDRAVVGRWTHVAATHDGATMRLYVDGVEVASARTRAPLRNTSGPVLMGNDGSQRLFRGAIDNVSLDARALSPSEIQGLLCVRGAPTLVASPSVSAPTAPGTPAVYDITIQNNDSPACGPSDFFFGARNFTPGIVVAPEFSFVPQVPGGGSSVVAISATADDTVEPGSFVLPIDVSANQSGLSGFTTVEFVVASTGCRVSRPRELMITNLSVVDDLSRTRNGGVWSFQHLMESMAPTPAEAPAMVEAMLSTFTVPQTINGFTVEARPGMQDFVLANWPRTASGQLDLARAPLTLQAIVNRFDLRNPAQGDAGEGRFVFGFDGPFGFPLQATLILEYKLPASSPAEVNDWAQSWHALGALPFPSEEYNAALQAITERFAGRNARLGAPNGSAISTVRTNEIDLGFNGRWELREFRLSPTTGLLVPSTLDRTPDASFNGSDLLSSFVNDNEAAIITESHSVPTTLAGAPFAAGAVFNDFIPWNAASIASSEARFRFSTNTCNGCHSPETGTFFLQVSPRFPGSEAFLSSFLTGTTVFDAVTGEPRQVGELARRASGLRAVVCP